MKDHENEPTARLTVYLDDGRTLAGVYGWLEAHARAEWAKQQPGYLRHTMEETPWTDDAMPSQYAEPRRAP